MTSVDLSAGEQEKVQRLEGILAKAFPDYQDFTYVAEGTSAVVYSANWGAGEQPKPRAIKIDKAETDVKNVRAQRYLKRGCGTSREIDASEAFSKHDLFLTVHQYKDLQPFGHDGEAVVMEYFPNSTTLDEYVDANGAMNRKEFRTISRQLITAARAMNKEGWYHRDYSVKNTLVNESLDVKIADLRNAIPKENVQESMLPTAGARRYSDPLLHGTLTGEERTYSDQSELYALGAVLLRAATGMHPPQYDPDEQTASSAHFSDLLTNGKIDPGKHCKALDEILNDNEVKLPEVSHVIKKFMTLDERERYDSLEQGLHALENSLAPTYMEALMQNWGKVMASVSLMASLYTTALFVPEREIVKPEIDRQWDGSSLTLENNVVDLEVGASNISVPVGEQYPELPTIHAKPGDDIRIVASIQYKAASKEQLGLEFPVKIYLEGHDSVEETIKPRPFDRNDEPKDHLDYQIFGARNGYTEITIPDMPRGVYNIAVELYGTSDERANVAYPEGEWIAREPIPITIGEDLPRVKGANINPYQSRLRVEIPGDENMVVLPKYQLNMNIPGIFWNQIADTRYGRWGLANLPQSSPPGTHMLEAVLNNGSCSPTWLPIMPTSNDLRYSNWRLSIGGDDWSKMIKARWEKIEDSCK